MKTILSADWVFPIITPPSRDAAVVVQDERVVQIGPATAVRRDHPDAQFIDLGGHTLLPGLINSHAHLELSRLKADQLPHQSFVQWITKLRSALQEHPADPAEAALQGARESVRFGITHVGDISQSCHATRAILRHGPLRITSFGEALGLAKLRPRFESALTETSDLSLQSPYLSIGISPHAPYTVDLGGYRQCLRIANSRNLPLATHLSEVPEEREFLQHQTGPLRQLWDNIGLWADPVETFNGSPIAMAKAIGLLDYPSLLAHVNDVTEDELIWLSQGRASVVYCPRTHAWFNRPPHPWRRMMQMGINIALGTDSCASSPDLNLLDDLRLLHHQAPDLPADLLWRTITLNAARALLCHGGAIAPGNMADLVSFTTTTDNPLLEILETGLLPDGVWIGGQRIVG